MRLNHSIAVKAKSSWQQILESFVRGEVVLLQHSLSIRVNAWFWEGGKIILKLENGERFEINPNLPPSVAENGVLSVTFSTSGRTYTIKSLKIHQPLRAHKGKEM
jgi:hypothetical protein